MRYIFLGFFICFFNVNSFSLPQNDTTDIDYARSGDYFPYVVLTEEDSIYYPITYQIELFVNDLYDLNVQNNFFTAEITAGVYSDYDRLSSRLSMIWFSTLSEIRAGGYVSIETKDALDVLYNGWYYCMTLMRSIRTMLGS